VKWGRTGRKISGGGGATENKGVDKGLVAFKTGGGNI